MNQNKKTTSIKHLEAIQCAIRHAKDTIEILACENYPYTDFFDEEFRKMFVDLTKMSLLLTKKVEEEKERNLK